MEPGKTERVYRRIAKFAEKVQGKGIWTRNIEEKRLETERVFRRFTKFAYEVMPAGCGWDFEGISSPQSPDITARNYRTCNGVVGGQAQMIVQESARGMPQSYRE